MTPLTAGIIGFGRIGAEHAGWMAMGGSVSPAAASDATSERRALAEAGGLKAVAEIDELLDDRSISAVLISTPTALHFEQALRALAAGKHVMVEKPLALDLAQSRRLVEEAARRKLVLSVFHNRRWDPDYLTVCEAVASGVLGRIINVESRLDQFASCVGPAAREWRPGWRNEQAFGGGGLYDWGSHFIDQLWRLLLPARPLRVFAQLRANVWTGDCDDFARVCIDFDSGAVGLMEINTTTTQPQARWRLDGTEGSAAAPASAAFDTAVWAGLRFIPAAGGAAPRALPRAAPGLSEPQIWEQFAAAVRGEGPPAVGAASVLPTMALLDAARESSRSGTAVAVRETVEWVF